MYLFIYKNNHGVNSIGLTISTNNGQSIGIINGFNWGNIIHSVKELQDILDQIDKDNKLYKIVKTDTVF